MEGLLSTGPTPSSLEESRHSKILHEPCHDWSPNSTVEFTVQDALHCRVYCTVNITVHKRQNGWLIPLGTLPSLSPLH